MSKQQIKSEKQVKKPSVTISEPANKFLFERRNYMILFAGLALLAIGFLLMTGGHQPPDQFDPKIIYGFRNATLSSFVVVIGFLVVLYSIFAKHSSQVKIEK